jgi:hypothetical protein
MIELYLTSTSGGESKTEQHNELSESVKRKELVILRSDSKASSRNTRLLRPTIQSSNSPMINFSKRLSYSCAATRGEQVERR